MPYAPGVQDISGQLYGQGMSSLGRGIGAFLKAREEKAEQNKQFTARSQALEKYIKANADQFGGEEQVGALLEVDPSESPIARFQKLQGVMENTIAGNKIRESQEQQKLHALQQEAAKLDIAKAQQEQQQLSRLRQLAQYGQLAPAQATGAVAPGAGPMNAAPMPQGMNGPASLGSMMRQGLPGSGVLSPQAQQQMARQLQDPMTQFAAQYARATGRMPSDRMMAAAITPAKPTKTTPLIAGGEVVFADPTTSSVVNRVPITPAPPDGYERVTGGAVRPIPGGPAAQKQADDEAGKKTRKQAEASQVSVMLDTIDNLLGKGKGDSKINLLTTGFGSVTKVIPGSPAADVAAQLDTLVANIGFRALDEMRQASKTGGALGQVAVRELELLQATLGSLEQSQSPDQLKEHLMNVRQSLRRWQSAKVGNDGDSKESTQSNAATAPSGSAENAKSILDKYGIK